MSYTLKDKIALVTGAGRGIGLALATRLAGSGCNVVIADLALTDEAEELVEKHTKAPKVIFQKTDATDWAQLEAAFDITIKTFGGVDIVCPGAGLFEPPFSNFWQPSKITPGTNSYKTFDLNINHPVRATQLAIDHFIRASPDKPSGTVLLVSSIAAQIAAIPVPLYCASKAAISSFAHSMGMLEQLNGIRVVCVAPGNVRTRIWSSNGVNRENWLQEGQDEWVPIEKIVDGMINLIPKQSEGGQYESGTVLEVTLDGNREVKSVNDPGPTGKGATVSNYDALIGEVTSELATNFGK